MSLAFSSSSDNLGIVEQARALTRLDSTQFPTSRIVASCNNYLDTVTGYAIGADKRFQFDDTNHSKLPIGTTDLTANQKDYSFLTDEQGNTILTLTRIDLLQSDGLYRQLESIDQMEITGALDEFEKTANTPVYYDKIADNIVRLYPKPSTTVSAGLKFYFQRTASYFTASDTTKSPGVSPLLHRGFVIASAYDCAMAFGLNNVNFLASEMQREQQKMIQYFADRNRDEKISGMRPNVEDNR